MIRRYEQRPGQVMTIAQSSIVFAVGALEGAVADIGRTRLHKACRRDVCR